MPIFVTSLFFVSALLLGAWFVALLSLWQGPAPVAAQDQPKPIESFVEQKLIEVTGKAPVK